MSKVNLTCFPPGFNQSLFGRAPRTALAQLEGKLGQLRRSSLSELSDVFGEWVPERYLEPKRSGPNSRRRLFSGNVTFWAFLFQVLSPQTACREVVRKVQSYCSMKKLKVAKGSASAYCQARQRLSLDDLHGIHRAVTARMAGRVITDQLWKGHDVKVVDGTGITTADTPCLQKRYPQPCGQSPGCGFPVVKLAACFSLASGALLHWVESSLGHHDSPLLRRMIAFFKKGDVVLADRGFCSYANIALLVGRGVEVVMRLHQKRKSDFRQGRPLGSYDRLIVWKKPQSPIGFSRREWRRLPREMPLRAVRIFVSIKGFRSRTVDLVTTFTDPESYTHSDLAELYYRRWAVELYFRHIKSTMGMEMLRGRSEDVVRKEIAMFAIAYNLIRALMQQAAGTYQCDLSRLSFKAAADTLRQYQSALAATRFNPRSQRCIVDHMIRLIACESVPLRPFRCEPRVLKRRQKPFQRLTQPRALMTVSPSRKNKGYYRPKPALS